MTTNRQRAERGKMTTQEYFYYAKRALTGSHSFLRASQFDQPLSYYMCDECNYIPNVWCENPKQAFRIHVKKHHRAKFLRDFAKPFVIREETITEDVDVDAFLRELLDA